MPARIYAAMLFAFLAALSVAPLAASGADGPSVGSLRFQGPQRAAVERCAPLLERYGRMRIDDVRRNDRNAWRVDGTVGGAALGNSNGWRKGFAPRAFICTVRDDGQVKLKTSRLRF